LFGLLRQAEKPKQALKVCQKFVVLLMAPGSSPISVWIFGASGMSVDADFITLGTYI